MTGPRHAIVEPIAHGPTNGQHHGAPHHGGFHPPWVPRCLPPAYSPIPADAYWGAIHDIREARDDPRRSLARHLCRQFSAESAALYSTGTEALTAAIRTARRLLGGRAPIALPAYSCYDVATAAVAGNSRIALYDIDPLTLAPDMISLGAAMSAGARVVVVAPLWGYVPPWEEIDLLARVHGAIVIEDAAQSFGSTWRSRIAGTHGAISVLSFGRGKAWTGGKGGALLARGEAVEAVPPAETKSREPWWVGAARVGAQRMLSNPALYALPSALPFLHLGETRYHEPRSTHGISPIAARFLERSWTSALREAVARRRNGRAYAAVLATAVSHPEHAGVPHLISTTEHTRPGFLRFPVRIPGGWAGLSNPDAARHAGMAPGYPTTLAALAPVRDRMTLPTGVCHWPGAELLSEQVVTLPTHSLVTEADRADIVRLVLGTA